MPDPRPACLTGVRAIIFSLVLAHAEIRQNASTRRAAACLPRSTYKLGNFAPGMVVLRVGPTDLATSDWTATGVSVKQGIEKILAEAPRPIQVVFGINSMKKPRSTLAAGKQASQPLSRHLWEGGTPQYLILSLCLTPHCIRPTLLLLLLLLLLQDRLQYYGHGHWVEDDV